MTSSAEREEWAASWPVPFVASFGITGSAAFAYASGVFIGPMTAALGWSRAAFSSAFTLQMVAMLVFLPLVGRLIDRIGPRRVALAGLVPAAAGLSLLGLAGRSVWLWWGLCLLQATCGMLLAPPTWISGVARSFRHSRGVPLSIALTGVGLAMTIWPPITAFVIQHVGWRPAFAVLALGLMVVLAPLTLLSFHSPWSPVPAASAVPFHIGSALASRTFICVIIAGGLFSTVSFGLTLSLVPILRAGGLSLTQAAGIAGLTGLSSIAGRLGTGFLLDRMPTRVLGTLVFLLPVVVSLLLLQGNAAMAPVAACLLGLAGGAETDVITYITAQRFSRDGFASVYSIVIPIMGVCASLGPLIASALFDASRSYGPFLLLTVPLVIVASAVIGLVPSPQEDVSTQTRPAR